MKYVFGPVASRRLGRSLGIDPLSAKTCNWNCVYCQLGRTPRLTSKREDFAPLDNILREVDQALERALNWTWTG
jgi:wyosine [tRNA(Phe)-imidazoG37] synthetase (radical SAM superfamily)